MDINDINERLEGNIIRCGEKESACIDYAFSSDIQQGRFLRSVRLRRTARETGEMTRKNVTSISVSD